MICRRNFLGWKVVKHRINVAREMAKAHPGNIQDCVGQGSKQLGPAEDILGDCKDVGLLVPSNPKLPIILSIT